MWICMWCLLTVTKASVTPVSSSSWWRRYVSSRQASQRTSFWNARENRNVCNTFAASLPSFTGVRPSSGIWWVVPCTWPSDNIVTWKRFPYYWPVVRESTPEFLSYTFDTSFGVCLNNCWTNMRVGDLRRHVAHATSLSWIMAKWIETSVSQHIGHTFCPPTLYLITLRYILASVLEFLISICGLLYTWFTLVVLICHQFTSSFLSFQLTYLFMTGILVGIVISFQVPLYVDRQNLPAFLLLVILFG